MELDPTAERTHAALPNTLASDAPIVAVWRGDLIESVHYGRYVFCDAQGERKDYLGDTEGYVYLRSSAKPFQALPLVFSGAADAFGLTSEELAVACASHSGEPRHLAAVRSILHKAGLSESDLQNGTHPPRHALTAARLARNGDTPRPIHGNCSGKHAGMLAVCVYAGWDPAGYRDPEGPLQKLVQRTVAKLCGIEPEAIRTAGDGCGVPVFALPLQKLALSFARLFTDDAKAFPEDLLEAVCRVRDAMRVHPFMVAGTGRFDTSIMKETDLIAKSGAEGVFAAGSPEGWGLALKVSDGASRAVAPTALAVLNRKGVRVPMEIEVGTMKDLHGKAVGKVAPLLQNNP
ncbi:MAG TPA: asparaginase [Rubrobacteraceae bacterium]|nr:asparaginase [Rubrobacteraceae bacterium]